MKKLVHLYFMVAYITLGFVGVLLSTHIFTDHYLLKDFYIYYTNLSNIICIFTMCLVVYNNTKFIIGDNSYKRIKEQQSIEKLKQVSALIVLITCIVYNTVLSDFSWENYWSDLYNLLFHIILPIWFVVWTIFTTKKIFWWTPICTVSFQVIYVFVVYLRSLILKNSIGRIVYPYFFLNFETLGFWGSVKWMSFMVVATLIIGYLFLLIIYGINKIKICNKKTTN